MIIIQRLKNQEDYLKTKKTLSAANQNPLHILLLAEDTAITFTTQLINDIAQLAAPTKQIAIYLIHPAPALISSLQSMLAMTENKSMHLYSNEETVYLGNANQLDPQKNKIFSKLANGLYNVVTDEFILYKSRLSNVLRTIISSPIDTTYFYTYVGMLLEHELSISEIEDSDFAKEIFVQFKLRQQETFAKLISTQTLLPTTIKILNKITTIFSDTWDADAEAIISRELAEGNLNIDKITAKLIADFESKLFVSHKILSANIYQLSQINRINIAEILDKNLFKSFAQKEPLIQMIAFDCSECSLSDIKTQIDKLLFFAPHIRHVFFLGVNNTDEEILNNYLTDEKKKNHEQMQLIARIKNCALTIPGTSNNHRSKFENFKASCAILYQEFPQLLEDFAHDGIVPNTTARRETLIIAFRDLLAERLSSALTPHATAEPLATSSPEHSDTTTEPPPAKRTKKAENGDSFKSSCAKKSGLHFLKRTTSSYNLFPENKGESRNSNTDLMDIEPKNSANASSSNAMSPS